MSRTAADGSLLAAAALPELLGATNMGTAMVFGTIAFAITLVVGVLLRS